MDKKYDLIIVGTGPAGYTAGIYASRYRVDNLLIGNMPGGQIAEAHKVCNFPGFPEITGMALGEKMREHAKDAGSDEILDEVSSITKNKDSFVIETKNSGNFKATVVLLAHGTKRRRLGLKNEEKFIGRGISYCATCDAGFFKDQRVGVIGGSNAATTAALLLADIASKVFLIYRKDKLRGDQVWIENVKKRSNIEIIYNTNVIKLLGESNLSGVKLDTPYKNKDTLALDGLFVEIGSLPNLDIVKTLGVSTDKAGYVEVDANQATNIKNLYAAGDITNASDGFRQVVTACGEGAIAARSIYEVLANINN